MNTFWIPVWQDVAQTKVKLYLYNCGGCNKTSAVFGYVEQCGECKATIDLTTMPQWVKDKKK
jgi:hypothetical protein